MYLVEIAPLNLKGICGTMNQLFLVTNNPIHNRKIISSNYFIYLGRGYSFFEYNGVE
jgi:hypothetical protein